MNPKAFGYIRLLEDETPSHAETDIVAIRREFEYRYQPRGYEFGGIFIDLPESSQAPLAQRPEGHRLMLAISDKDAVIFPSLERGWRSRNDFIKTSDAFQQRGVKLCIADLGLDPDQDQGKILQTVISRLIAFERKRISQKISESYQRKRELGIPFRLNPSTPFGFRSVGRGVNRVFVRDDDVRNVAGMIYDMVQSGWSYTKIFNTFLEYDIVNPKTKRPFGRKTLCSWYHQECRLREQERLVAQQQQQQEQQEQQEQSDPAPATSEIPTDSATPGEISHV